MKTSSNNAIQLYFDQITEAGGQTLIDKPTRITGYSTSLVDHIYTNDPYNKLSPAIILTDMSDHLPIFLVLGTTNPIQNTDNSPKLIRVWKNFDISAYRNELSNKLAVLNTGSIGLDGKTKLKKFMKITEQVINKYLPLRPCTNKVRRIRENPWMSNAIYKAICYKDKLYFKQLKHRTLTNILAGTKHIETN